ncbi:MAG: hypothetical protein F4Y26_17765 [Gammaproteobacteria bacterium]|nr:hypothetical protein [Gammaproteobacteria bacterium]
MDQLQPAHVAAGIGGAERAFLAVCLSVFDDANLRAQVKRGLEKLRRKWPFRGLGEVAHESVRQGADQRLREDLSDDQLRAMLWIKLRQAFNLAPAVSQSVRGTEVLTDELVASGLHWRRVSDSEGLLGRTKRGVKNGLARLMRRDHGDELAAAEPTASTSALADLAEPILERMLEVAFGEDSGAMGESDRQRVIRDIHSKLDEDQRKVILERVGGDDPQRALLTLMATGGAHGTFAAAVASTGFAPYILAAQASAFVPLVSGPALVSFVSVLANPVVVLVTIAVAGIYLKRKAEERAAAHVALHVIALLACDGLDRRRKAIECLVASFATIPDLPDDTLASTDRDDAAVYRQLLTEANSAPWLSTPGPRPQMADTWESRDANRDSVAIGALSIGDLLYSLAAMDPAVVAAADFSSSEDIDDPLDFAVSMIAKAGERWDPSAQAGDIARLKGFTMEQLAATKLASDGHVVSLPAGPTERGWDLMVDGEPLQVKCLADDNGLAEHFEKYPDIPVLANVDLIERRDRWPEVWREQVYFLDGYTNEVVENVVERSVKAAKDLGDSDLPEIALAYVAAQKLWQLGKGEVTMGQAASHLLIEGTARSGLAIAGGVLGAAVGLLVLGPAGALVVGHLAPVAAQGGAPALVRWFKGLGDDKQAPELESFCWAGVDAIDRKRALFRTKHQSLGAGAAGTYARYRLVDEMTHLEESRDRLVALTRDRRDPAERLLDAIRTTSRAVHPASVQRALKRALSG